MANPSIKQIVVTDIVVGSECYQPLAELLNSFIREDKNPLSVKLLIEWEDGYSRTDFQPICNGKWLNASIHPSVCKALTEQFPTIEFHYAQEA